MRLRIRTAQRLRDIHSSAASANEEKLIVRSRSSGNSSILTSVVTADTSAKIVPEFLQPDATAATDEGRYLRQGGHSADSSAWSAARTAYFIEIRSLGSTLCAHPTPGGGSHPERHYRSRVLDSVIAVKTRCAAYSSYDTGGISIEWIPLCSLSITSYLADNFRELGEKYNETSVGEEIFKGGVTPPRYQGIRLTALPQIASIQRHGRPEKIESLSEISVEEEFGGVRPPDDTCKDRAHAGYTGYGEDTNEMGYRKLGSRAPRFLRIVCLFEIKA